jgi:hypothetical protein
VNKNHPIPLTGPRHFFWEKKITGLMVAVCAWGKTSLFVIRNRNWEKKRKEKKSKANDAWNTSYLRKVEGTNKE